MKRRKYECIVIVKVSYLIIKRLLQKKKRERATRNEMEKKHRKFFNHTADDSEPLLGFP
jgi:hypothetical protein